MTKVPIFMLRLDDPNAVSSLPSRCLNLMPVRKLCLAHVVVCLPVMSGSVANLKVTFPGCGGVLASFFFSVCDLGITEGRRMVQSLGF